MNWSKPKDEHIIYEALSAIADGRFEMTGENKAKSTSTSKGKFYEIDFEPENNAIMSNDNLAYYRGEVSYPMVAMFLVKGIFPYDKEILKYFVGIKWKDINQKNKNDYMKSVHEFLERLEKEGVDVKHIDEEVQRIFKGLLENTYTHLGEKRIPPQAY